MKDFIIKRFAQTLLVLVFVSMFAFSIIYFSPGDPLYLYTSPAVSSYKMTEEQLNDMREALGLNGNVVERRGRRLRGIGDCQSATTSRLKSRFLISCQIQ